MLLANLSRLLGSKLVETLSLQVRIADGDSKTLPGKTVPIRMGGAHYTTRSQIFGSNIDAPLAGTSFPSPQAELPCPRLEELLSLGRVRGKELWLVSAWTEDRVRGAGMFALERLRMHGVPLRVLQLYGADLCDYVCLHGDDPDCHGAILSEAKRVARTCAADALLMRQLVDTRGFEADTLRKWAHSYRCHIFDTARSENGWRGIYARDSVKRHWKKAQRLPGYRVEHFHGRLDAMDLERLARLHKERWAWEGLRSRLEDPLRVREYAAYAANKLLTNIWVRDELLACHYGMVYGTTILWHTPVINVKFLHCSPLEVLLAETAECCEQTGARVLDLGLGLEDYKSRFANGYRDVIDLFIPLTARGWAVYAMRKTGLTPVAKRFGNDVRRRWVRTLAKLAVVREVFELLEAPALPRAVSVSEDLQGGVIRTYPEFVDFARVYGLVLRKYQYARFRAGCSFAHWTVGNVITCHAWVVSGKRWQIEEIGRDVDIGDRILVFDLRTADLHCGDSFCTELLRFLRRQYCEHVLVTYTSVPSPLRSREIKLAGFMKVDLICGGLNSRQEGRHIG